MIEQGTPEWHAMRCGKVTASRIADLTAKTKSGWGASRANYMAQLIAERLTGTVADSYTNASMEWGNQTEAQARDAYSFIHGVEIDQVAFVDHPGIEMCGASPDGLIGENGLIEIKCPNTATHIETLLSGKVPAKYIKQMQWQMDCAQREWCDFVSFDPRMPEHMQMFVCRIEIDNEMLNETAEHVMQFQDELNSKLNQLTSQYKLESAA